MGENFPNRHQQMSSIWQTISLTAVRISQLIIVLSVYIDQQTKQKKCQTSALLAFLRQVSVIKVKGAIIFSQFPIN